MRDLLKKKVGSQADVKEMMIIKRLILQMSCA